MYIIKIETKVYVLTLFLSIQVYNVLYPGKREFVCAGDNYKEQNKQLGIHKSTTSTIDLN